jgi:two-component system, chemotaxis family, sensor kinase CheA
MNSEAQALMSTFLEEARDNLAVLERGLLRLEIEPQHIDSIHEIFRAAHSVKGGAGLVGLKKLAEFTHRLETVLDSMRQGHLPVDSAVISALLNATDELRRLIDGVSNNITIEGDERVFSALLVHLEKPPAPIPICEELVLFDSPSLRTVELRVTPKTSLFATGLDPKLLFVDLESLGNIMSVMCDMSRIPALSKLVPTDCYISWSVRILTEVTDSAILDVFSFVAEDCSVEIVGGKVLEPEVKPVINREVIANLPATHHESATLRVNSEKVDSIIDLVGELVIAQSMVMQLLGPSVVTNNPMLRDAAESMRRNMQELQERVMGIRMVPIVTLFGRFTRIVRDTATALKKTVYLEFEGQETEIDKAVVERLADPLTHLVRNALDHGIETDEERLALGKLDRAMIRLRGKHVAGGVVIEVEDNGRGLNTAKILEKAKKQGLIAGNEQLTDDQIHALIFAPGFSTAEVVSDLSGRGVGMDVVRRSVDALNGSISISTVPGEGTTLRIRIPLTLAILDGLTLRVGSQPYIVPLLTVVESFRPKPASIKHVTGVGVVAIVRDVALPLVDLGVELGITKATCDPCSALVVVVEADGRQIGLVVDAMIGQSQVVVKSVETHYRRVEGVLGATILGDGTVAFIIDVAGVVRLTLAKKLQNGASFAA